MSNNIRVQRIAVAGAPFHGLRTNLGEPNPAKGFLQGKGVGVTYHIVKDGVLGTASGRIDDLPPEMLGHTLVPNAYSQAHVRRSDLVIAERIIEQHPQILDRFKPSEDAPINWGTLPFGLNCTDRTAIFFAKVKRGGNWSEAVLNVEDHIYPYGEFPVLPATQVFHYGQGGWEGMKAIRWTDGRIVGFRWKENAARMIRTMTRLASTPATVKFYLDAIGTTVLANKELVPPAGHGGAALYIRPFQFGYSEQLGVKPATVEAFAIFVSPVGPYYTSGQLEPIRLRVEENIHRAGEGGTGNVKAEGNYIIGMIAQLMAQAAGFKEVVYLDAQHNTYIEELGSGNIFFVRDGKIYTPSLESGTILPGITRASVIELARAFGYEVLEERVPLAAALTSQESFVTGNAAVITPIQSLTYRDHKVIFNGGKVGQVTQKLYKALVAIQEGRFQDDALSDIRRDFLERIQREWIFEVKNPALPGRALIKTV